MGLPIGQSFWADGNAATTLDKQPDNIHHFVF
jgi:hypothetical protein